jgi:hypothetical protein
MPGVDFRLARERIAMKDILRLLKFEATFRRGDQWRGPCPVHGLQNPRSCSFSVNVRLGRQWILRERSQRDVVLIWTSLVSQDGRREQYCARRSETPERLP